MSVPLPDLTVDELAAVASRFCAEPQALAGRLHAHYIELQRWNPRLSLIGPGTVGDVLERHYLESLLALEWLPEVEGALLDVGSGAGFPGVVLAAARPLLRVVLAESNQRKAAFLRQAAARMQLEVDVVDRYLDRNLPQEVPERLDFLTLRAVRLPFPGWRSLVDRLKPDGRVLLWASRSSPAPGLSLLDTLPLPGSQRREIRLYARAS